MAYGNNDNAIEFYTNGERATVTFTQGRFINKIKKLAERNPGNVEIIAENEDGSLCAHVPVSWIKISPPRTVSEEQRAMAAERLKSLRNPEL